MITLSKRQIWQAILLALVIILLLVTSITAFQSMKVLADQPPMVVASGPAVDPDGHD